MAVMLFCAILSLTIFLYFTYFCHRKQTKNIPPLAEPALPIVGHTFLVFANRKNFYHLLVDILLGPALKKGKEAVTLRIGFWNMYVLMDPEDSYLVANSCLNKDPFGYRFLKPLMGDYGLITADEPVWNRHRKLLNPAFNQSVLSTYLKEFNDKSRQLVRDLVQEAGKGLFDPLPYTRRTVLQIVCVTIIGVNMNLDHYTEKVGEALEMYSSAVVERTFNILSRNDFLFSLTNMKKKRDKAIAYLNEMNHKVLRMKKRKPKAEEEKEFTDASKFNFKPFLDLLIELSQNGTLTDAEIQEELNAFIGGAFDSTYHIFGLTLLTLGSYPEVQQKVFQEQQETFNGSDRDVKKQDLAKLKYLEAVIKETMRLYPVIFLIGRRLDKDVDIKNYTLPAGSSCYFSIYHLCRHPVWGPDVDQFRPERWLDGSLPSNVTKAYAVYGLGKRNCIGSNFGMMMVKIVLSHVLRHYSISGDVTQLVQKYDIVVTPASGHEISIERRANIPMELSMEK